MKISILTLGTRGDVQPFVALAQKALEKGHQAVICTGKTFKPFIEAAGIEFKEAASDLMAMTIRRRIGLRIFRGRLKALGSAAVKERRRVFAAVFLCRTG